MRVKRLCVFFALAGILEAYPQQNTYSVSIDSVTVTGNRPLREAGIQKTVIDTFLLHESVASSLADLLSQGSTLFIKSYGRATLSTASFRGTGPSHTQVFWNGLRLNSPMLGTVDFSTVPSSIVDRASLYHGSGSTVFSGGGLGGAVSLGTALPASPGFSAGYTQGIGSFRTFDEYARVGYRGRRLGASVRFVHSCSPNDYPFVNRDKKIIITDQEGNVIDKYYPTERNRNGDFRDMHILAQLAYDAPRAGAFDLSAWYFDSRRGVPLIKASYGDDRSTNRQDERTLRLAGRWNKTVRKLRLSAVAGYSYTDLRYFAAENPPPAPPIADSRNYMATFSGNLQSEWYSSDKFNLTATVSFTRDRVYSRDAASLAPGGNEPSIHVRVQYDVFAGARWRPWERLTLAANLRQEFIGTAPSPFIPAAFIEVLLSRKGRLLLKASAVRNHRAPTLNDLYYRPGGNSSLRGEKGRTFDCGLEFTLSGRRLQLHGELSAYDSRIRNWILWLPSRHGFWSPANKKLVRSSGAELKLNARWHIGARTDLYLNGWGAYTRAINHGDPTGASDRSEGRQLVYIPRWSTAATARLTWRGWEAAWKWSYVSERFATTSNDPGDLYTVPGICMNDVSLGWRHAFRWGLLSVRVRADNLFDRDYISVLSRPMPGRNWGLSVEYRFPGNRTSDGRRPPKNSAAP